MAERFLYQISLKTTKSRSLRNWDFLAYIQPDQTILKKEAVEIYLVDWSHSTPVLDLFGGALLWPL